jgi:tripartite ATP-independent transporter DctM subunit
MLLLQSIDVASSYTLMVIPLFIVLGTLASASGITTDLFTMFYRWFGRIRGGVAISTIGTCAGMASITGSSVATSAAMTRIALPELRRFGYSERLSVGTIANGGTLSIMIPPSITLVLYAIFAEQSVGKMLVAGVLPGLILTLGFIAAISIHCWIRPQDGPAGPVFSWQQRFQSLPGVLPFFFIVGAIIMGILTGIWTPVESAAVAVILVAVMGFGRRRIGLHTLVDAARDAVTMSASVFMIVIGSMVFSNFLALNGVSQDITDGIMALHLSPFMLFVLLVGIYIVLGMFMEVSSLMALTIPLVMPLVTAVGWNPIWFGVVIVLLMELAMVTPPVGMNLYAVKAVAPDVDLTDIYLGSLPFWFVNIVIIFLFYFWPQITLILPNMV